MRFRYKLVVIGDLEPRWSKVMLRRVGHGSHWHTILVLLA